MINVDNVDSNYSSYKRGINIDVLSTIERLIIYSLFVDMDIETNKLNLYR